MIRFRPISHFLDPSSKEGGCSSGEIARNPGENIYIYIERKGRKKMLVGKAGSSQAIHSEYVSISSLYSWL